MEIEETFAEHSPLGASSAERWMNCPGSNVLLKQLDLPASDEPDYRRDGIAAHEAAAEALKHDQEAWEIVGQKFHDTEVTPEMADAVQMYLSFVRSLPPGVGYVEQTVGATRSPTVNRKFYGTVDYGKLAGDTLYITDYKHGEGIVVEAEHNPQLMYYALAFVLTMPGMEKIERIILTIVQPRAWHVDGPIRQWETTRDALLKWGKEVLMPAMDRAELDEGLVPGKWCRFCPAKLVCPVLTGLFGAAAKANPKDVPNLSSARLGLEWELRDAVKFYIKAVDDEVMRRDVAGETVPGTKLVSKKAFRVWKPGAKEALTTELGEKAWTKPEIKSPAEIEKIKGKKAKKLVAQYAYMPDTGYTVASADDKKPGLRVSHPSEVFAGMVDKS